MGLLEGKNALVFGLANDKSIAWGIIQAFKREGANIGISYAGEMLERRVKPLAEKVDCKWVEECDVTKDEMITSVAEKAAAHFGKIDILVHWIAFAGREELSRPYYQTSRDGFKNAMDISVFSFVALTNAFLPHLNPGASIMCLTYGSGATKVAPHYNVMGVAKAAWNRWRGMLPGEEVTVEVAEDAGERLGRRRLSPAEADVLARADRSATVADILENSPLPDADLAEAVCALISSGVLCSRI